MRAVSWGDRSEFRKCIKIRKAYETARSTANVVGERPPQLPKREFSQRTRKETPPVASLPDAVGVATAVAKAPERTRFDVLGDRAAFAEKNRNHLQPDDREPANNSRGITDEHLQMWRCKDAHCYQTVNRKHTDLPRYLDKALSQLDYAEEICIRLFASEISAR